MVGAAGVAVFTIRRDDVPVPAETDLLNPGRVVPAFVYDVMGRSITPGEAEGLQATPEGRNLLSASRGAVRIDAALRARGRDVFYRETFGNEVFLSDVLGLLDGDLSPLRLAWALWNLGGRGTASLQVALARDVTLGGRSYRSGDVVSTGLGVPRGEYVPLGVRVFYDRGRVRAGITCALCHARVDAATGKVVEGAPNSDLDLGLILALATNPSALFTRTGVASLDPYRTKPDNIVRTASGRTAILPDPEALDRDVRAMLAAWPRGSFDSTPDGVSNPTSIPSVFTVEGHPYGWSGHAAIGPFSGLFALAANMHGLMTDPTADAAAAPGLLGIDSEVYLGTILQGAARPAYRFEPTEGRKPSEILAEADPTPGIPHLGRLATLPSFPRANYVTADGMIPVGRDGTVSGALEAVSAFQNSLLPPTARRPATGTLARGQDVFARAGCLACHSGPALTSHRIWPASVIGSEPTRARAFARTEAGIARPRVFAPGTPFPAPAGAELVDVPVPDEAQLKLAWGHNKTGGGYKVPSLIGLAWSAPYLHDGAVAVGPDPDRRPGVADALGSASSPDPTNSLRALVDRSLRAGVVAANRASPAARSTHVTGEGHAYWADREAGYSPAEQDALVAYLLSVDRPQPQPAVP